MGRVGGLKLWEVKGQHTGVVYDLASLIGMVEDMVEECDGEWVPANDYLKRLKFIQDQIKRSVPLEIIKAEEDESREIDRLSDLADAQSY